MQYFIIDTLNLAYRAHNANIELATAKGDPSGMFFGFTRTLLSLKKKYRGYKFIAVWDNRPVAKYALQPDYKAGRSSLSSTVSSQLSDIREFMRCCGVDQYQCKDEEADDVIASLVSRLKKEGASTIIVYSNDKDLLQLVETGKVVVYKPKVANSPEKFYDEAAVQEQFGVLPNKLAIFRSLDGDSSDCIRGVPKVERKLIARVVNASNSVESFYSAIDNEKLTDFQRKSFQEAKSRVLINEKIVTLKKDLQNIELDESKIDKDKIAQLFHKFDIRSMNPDTIADLFASALNIRYSEARPTFRVESESLF